MPTGFLLHLITIFTLIHCTTNCSTVAFLFFLAQEILGQEFSILFYNYLFCFFLLSFVIQFYEILLTTMTMTYS